MTKGSPSTEISSQAAAAIPNMMAARLGLARSVKAHRQVRKRTICQP